jgi:Gpi18-like mannosyltransferase
MLPDYPSSDYPTRAHWLLYLLLFTTLVLLTPHAGMEGDVMCWVSWATYMRNHGLTRGYEAYGNNYTPLYQYVLFAYGKLAGDADHIFRNRHLLKIVTLLFDFGGAILAVRRFGWGDSNQRFMLSLLFLLNVGYLYNTVAWEQVDAILGTLVFWAVVQALRQRTVSSMVLFVLAINMKSQGIIFLPPLGLLWLPQWWQAPRRLGQGLLLGAAVQLLLLAPYIAAGKLSVVYGVVTSAVGYFPYASVNCLNLWALFLPPYGTSDALRWAGLTYKQWGLLSFLVAATGVLLPLALTTWYKLRSRTTFGPPDYALVLLSLGLVSLVFCFFNTQMHERYWHPALLLLGSYALLTRRYALFAIFSGAYFLNLEFVSMYQLPHGTEHKTLLFKPKLIASLFTIVLVGSVWQLYQVAGLRATWRRLRQPGAPLPPAALA